MQEQVPRAGFVGMGGMACLLFLVVLSPRLVPWWVALALAALWIAAMVAAVRWFVARPRRLPWLVVVGVAVWALVVPGAGALGAWSG